MSIDDSPQAPNHLRRLFPEQHQSNQSNLKPPVRDLEGQARLLQERNRQYNLTHRKHEHLPTNIATLRSLLRESAALRAELRASV